MRSGAFPDNKLHLPSRSGNWVVSRFQIGKHCSGVSRSPLTGYDDKISDNVGYLMDPDGHGFAVLVADQLISAILQFDPTRTVHQP